MMTRSRLLWGDSIAGLTAGALVLVLSAWLSALYRLPRWLIVFMALANVAYGAYSWSLARRSHRPSHLITRLVIANATWAVICLLTALAVARSASWFGLAHLVGESLFVGTLAAIEWRCRGDLTGGN